MAITKDLRAVRRNYETRGIHRKDMQSDPLVQFDNWMQEAIKLEVIDATAMTLATSSAAAMPSARIVLLKQYDALGFCWYSDSRSQKGRDLAENPQASLLVHWRDLSRQVRIVGKVEQLPLEEADIYFASRPEGSRFSAASSYQSSPIANRRVLESEVDRLRILYPDGQVPRPQSWVGYRLKPVYFEFWQGLVNRLHDRLVYKPDGDNWMIERLSP